LVVAIGGALKLDQRHQMAKVEGSSEIEHLELQMSTKHGLKYDL